MIKCDAENFRIIHEILLSLLLHQESIQISEKFHIMNLCLSMNGIQCSKLKYIASIMKIKHYNVIKIELFEYKNNSLRPWQFDLLKYLDKTNLKMHESLYIVKRKPVKKRHLFSQWCFYPSCESFSPNNVSRMNWNSLLMWKTVKINCRYNW